MSELATLEQRRQLVQLSADLQRATVRHRLDSIEQRPRLALFGSLAAIAATPGARRIAFAAALMAFRAWRRRR